MKTKIICPVDFSESANNAIEYAAKLAKAMNAEVTLVNVLEISAINKSNIVGEIGDDFTEDYESISKKLKLISEETHKTYAVDVNYEIDVSTKSLAKTISEHSEKNTIIVMGSNGADSMSQFFFGTNTYDVIKKSDCPLLLVPEGSEYNGYHHVLYPLVYKEKGKLALFQFSGFIKKFNSKITFLHVSEKDTVVSHEVFKAEKSEVEEFFIGSPNLHFERVFAEDIDDAIDDFVFKNGIDLLVIIALHRNIIESIFGKSPILSGLTAIAPCPILVFHA